MGTKDAPITGAIFSSCVLSHYFGILFSNRYGTGFMSHSLPLLLSCAL